MASIQGVKLELVENQGNAAALVTYTMFGNADDVNDRRTFREIVELMGIDEGAGEDGQNNRIANGLVFNGSVMFVDGNPIERRLLIPLTSAALDEDPSPVGGAPNEDEIKAQVSLNGGPIIASSNLVKRGGPPA